MVGLYWHIHHDTLIEWSDDINERIEYIRNYKPKTEQETRLRLLKPVRGDLDEARRAFAYNEAGRAYDEAWREFADGEAWRAWRALQTDPTVLALHAKECPDCPWDGHTIFPSA